MNLFEEAPDLSYRNRYVLDGVERVSCYSCVRTFHPSDIEEWTDAGQTAICPHCGIDAVLPGEISAQTLQALKEKWFAGTVK